MPAHFPEQRLVIEPAFDLVVSVLLFFLVLKVKLFKCSLAVLRTQGEEESTLDTSLGRHQLIEAELIKQRISDFW